MPSKARILKGIPWENRHGVEALVEAVAEAAMLPRLSAETNPPPLVPPSLLAGSLSPLDIARSLTSLIKVSCRL